MVPIYADRDTKQTIVYTKTNGTVINFFSISSLNSDFLSIAYLLPPMKNGRGRLVSLATLLAYGYASFIDDRPYRSRNFNIDQYLHKGNSMYSFSLIPILIHSILLFSLS